MYWKDEIQTKVTLYIYNLYKREIKEENWIGNTLRSKLIMRGRANSLIINWRNGFQNKSEQYPCCECETETLELIYWIVKNFVGGSRGRAH